MSFVSPAKNRQIVSCETSKMRSQFLLTLVSLVGFAMVVPASTQTDHNVVCATVIQRCANVFSNRMYVGISLSESCGYAREYLDCLADDCRLFDDNKELVKQLVQNELTRRGVQCDLDGGAHRATYGPLVVLCLVFVVMKTTIFKF